MKSIGIVAFAFGVPWSIRSNRCIASIASEKARELGAPVYTQKDIRVNSGVEVTYTNEGSGDNPPTTLRVARGAVEWAKRRKFTKLWIVAAGPHIGRCIRDIMCAVREAKTSIKVSVCWGTMRFSEEYWFCSDSKQLRTRSRFYFWCRECVLIWLMPFFIYKYVAS